MPGFTPVFGTGGVILPAQQTQINLVLTADTTLRWPLEQQVGGTNIAAAIITVTANAGPFAIGLPSAQLVSNGYAILFDNVGANSYTVEDAGGNTLLTVASGQAWVLYLTDNTTDNGTWRSFQQGAGASSANAATLAGAGLKAITTTLNQRWQFNSQAVNYVLVDGDRAKVVAWTGGVGQFTLPDPATVGSDWFAMIKNAGSGSLTVVPTAGNIDATTSLLLAPEESAFFTTDGTNFFSIGLGQDQSSIFDFITFSVAGSGDYVLSGAQLNRVSYELTGVLTGNRNIIVPNTVQQYWVYNNTSGAFALEVKTAAGTGVVIAQGNRAIVYCDGTNVVLAQTAGAVQFANGSAAAPSVTFVNFPTTGLYVAANVLGVSTAGVSRGTVDADGNWFMDAPTAGTDPTLLVTGRTGGVGVLTVTSPFSMAAATPGLRIVSTAGSGFATLSICADSNVAGTSDVALFQNGTNDQGTLINRSGALLNVVVGAVTCAVFDDAAPYVTLGVSVANSIRINNTTNTTIGAAGGASALPATPLGYWTVNMNGTPVSIPYYNP